jgi:hypothetical protein
MSNEIVFTNTTNVPEAFYPTPASVSLPDWYKDTSSYVYNEKKPTLTDTNTGTIKRCMPVFDAINCGYMLYTFTDVYVFQKDGIPYYRWNSFDPIAFHPIAQAPKHPKRGSLNNEGSYPKFNNPWSIKTPKGYSCLVINPIHRESIFTIFEGVVDTDEYTPPINIPFALNNWEYEGFIPAGTPMAQIIPFKRDNWKMKIGNEKDLKEQQRKTEYLSTSFFDSYKNKFRKSKEYK